MRGARSSAAIGYGTRFSSHHRFVRAFVEPCRLAARKSVERAARHAVEPLSRVGSREYIVFFLFCAAVVIAAAAAAITTAAQKRKKTMYSREPTRDNGSTACRAARSTDLRAASRQGSTNARTKR